MAPSSPPRTTSSPSVSLPSLSRTDAQPPHRSTLSLPPSPQFYGLFKQANVGDNDTKKPGMMDFAGKYKWEAWNKNKGLSTDEAKHKYVEHFIAVLDRAGSPEAEDLKKQVRPAAPLACRTRSPPSRLAVEATTKSESESLTLRRPRPGPRCVISLVRSPRRALRSSLRCSVFPGPRPRLLCLPPSPPDTLPEALVRNQSSTTRLMLACACAVALPCIPTTREHKKRTSKLCGPLARRPRPSERAAENRPQGALAFLHDLFAQTSTPSNPALAARQSPARLGGFACSLSIAKGRTARPAPVVLCLCMCRAL